MNKEETKDMIEKLIDIRNETEVLIIEAVFNYAVNNKLLPRTEGMDSIPYKKIIRTEFDLVI
jgi:hypothetical protein